MVYFSIRAVWLGLLILSLPLAAAEAERQPLSAAEICEQAGHEPATAEFEQCRRELSRSDPLAQVPSDPTQPGQRRRTAPEGERADDGEPAPPAH